MQKNNIILLIIIVGLISCAPKVVKKEPEPLKTPVVKTYFNGYVIRDNTNLREEPSTRSMKINKINDGEEVQVLQNKNGWYEVVTSQNQQGWIRSDFVGPENMSYTRMAAAFVDSTLKTFETELFIDENDPYEIIYMVLPQRFYENKAHVRRYADEIGRLYQKQVYPGEVQIRILQADKKTLFTRSILQKSGPVFLKAPYLKFGRPYSFELANNEITLKVLIPIGLSDKVLTEMAYEAAGKYGSDISKVEIYLVEDTDEGFKFFSQENYIPKNKTTCRLFYLEDSQGPDIKTNFCH